MTPDELQDAIDTLQRDLAETMQEMGDLGSRIWQLEHARDINHQKRGRGTPRFQTGYEPRITKRPPSPRGGGSG